MMLFYLAAPLMLLAQAALPQPSSADDVETQVKRFTQVFATVEANSADPVNYEAAFYNGALPAMLRFLDPHSVFLDPGQFDQLKQMEKSESKGFGSVVSLIPGRVIVLQTLPGTPSAKAGLAPGDEILAVNNIALGPLEFDQMVGVLTEARQRPAKIYVRRPGNIRVFEMTLIPELMEAPTVDRVFLLEPGIGYIRATSFDPKTGQLIHDAIEKLGGTKLKGLVLDLRNNPGGVVGAAVETASLFLKPGERVITVRGRNKHSEEVDVPKTAQPYNCRLAILVNAKTASASEIVSGAFQDLKRATIVGEKTYGKGLVQNVFPLASDTGMVLTIAFYYTPSGRSIQRPLKDVQLSSAIQNTKGGIEPDIVVEPESQSRLRQVIEGTASYTQFATDFVAKHKITETFDVTSDVLDDFKVFLSERRIQPGLADWFKDKESIRKRLRQEIFTIGLGVAKGDEIDAQLDPVIQRGLQVVSSR